MSGTVRPPSTDEQISELFKRVRDLERRQLPSFVDSWGLGRFISFDTGAFTLATDTLHQVDLTGGHILTNDTAPGATMGTHTSPFVGDHFTFDTSRDAFSLFVHSQGIYLVHRHFSVLSWGAAIVAPVPMKIVRTGISPSSPWLIANENIESRALVPEDSGSTSGNYAVRMTDIFIAEDATEWKQGLEVEQMAGTDGQAYAGISIVRLGSVFPDLP